MRIIMNRNDDILKKDFSRPVAYRIVFALGYTNQEILSEYSRPEELWQDELIKRHFASFNISEDAYIDDYLKVIADKGIYRLGYAYCIVYGDVHKSGRIKPRKPQKYKI